MSAGNVIVVDTNVWLDHFLAYRPNHAASHDFICEAVRQDIPLVIPSHALKDVFFIVQQQLKAANRADGALAPESAAACAQRTAWAIIDNVLEIAAVGPSDHSDALIAAKQRSLHSDYEDNLVVCTAMRVDARLLVTNDAALAKHASVATMTAEDALAYIKLG